MRGLHCSNSGETELDLWLLGMSDNEIGDEGIVGLVEGLESNSSLLELDLHREFSTRMMRLME